MLARLTRGFDGLEILMLAASVIVVVAVAFIF
jgi:hypothetical protein